MSFLLKKTDLIYFYLNNDTKDNSQQNTFNTMDIIQNEWHKLVFIKTSLYSLFKHQIFILSNMYCFKFGKISF